MGGGFGSCVLYSEHMKKKIVEKKNKGGRGKACFDRNRMIVRLVDLGESPKKIGEILGITEQTVYGIFNRDRAKYSLKILSTVQPLR